MTLRPVPFATVLTALAVAGLVGCKSVNLNPPPVVDRSSELQAGRRTTPPPAAATPAPVDANPVAVPTPIGNEGVDQRPIGTPLPSATPLPSSTPPASNAPLKTEPLGAKRPYSDATLAELAGEATPTAPAPMAAAPALTWAWPANGKVTTSFGGKSNGIDIAGAAGDPILAAADGKVTFAGTGVRGYGNFVIVRHTPELLSVYANNKSNLVKEGASVTRGQKIAELGMSEATSPRLHFEVRSDSKPIDPLKYLPPR